MKQPNLRKIPLLDLLAEQFPELSRERIFSRVLCGEIFVNGIRERDPKVKVPQDAELVFSERKFVSRGGFKLDAALQAWPIAVQDTVWLDAGASTGGFTDALLQRGARLVHAVDVGFNQLDFSLRQNPRVRSYEKTNIMAVEQLVPAPQAAAADLSFRSLKGAASQLLKLTGGGPVIALLKPQFEAEALAASGVAADQFKGIVADDLIPFVVRETLSGLAEEGVGVKQILASPLRGRAGNQEYLLWLEPATQAQAMEALEHLMARWAGVGTEKDLA